mgnify:CR=1 FL=1
MWAGSSPALSSRLALRALRSTWNLPVGSTSMADRAAAPMASVMALGTSPNPLIRMADEALDVNGKGCFIVNEETMETSRQAVYAGGDAVTGAATVILAMGAGKKAAKAIMKYLDANK